VITPPQTETAEKYATAVGGGRSKTMESRHIRGINKIAPQVGSKTFLLGKWSENQEVPDPYRKSREAFEHVYKLLDQFTDDWLKYL